MNEGKKFFIMEFYNGKLLKEIIWFTNRKKCPILDTFFYIIFLDKNRPKNSKNKV